MSKDKFTKNALYFIFKDSLEHEKNDLASFNNAPSVQLNLCETDYRFHGKDFKIQKVL